MKDFLFVGGQYHGHIMPVNEASIAFGPLRPLPDGRPYVGYRASTLPMAGGGLRLLAINEATSRNPARIAWRIADALSIALDNAQHANEIYRRTKRIVPRNVQLDDDPGATAELVPRQLVGNVKTKGT